MPSAKFEKYHGLHRLANSVSSLGRGDGLNLGTLEQFG